MWALRSHTNHCGRSPTFHCQCSHTNHCGRSHTNHCGLLLLLLVEMAPSFKKGETLLVRHTDGVEYPAKVIDLGKRGVKVHYVGWKKTW